MPPENEIPLEGGWMTAGVVRVGDTVRRPPGANAPLAHRLLLHLEEMDFDGTPRFRGLDEQGREVLTYVEGEVYTDCRSSIWGDDQLEAAARLLRRFHDATAGTELAGHAEVVCHNDFGPWNLVWRDELPIAIIDFDNVAPGAREDDLGYAVWKHLNLGLVRLSPKEQQRRFGLMSTAYGMAPDAGLVGTIALAQERMHRLIKAAPKGDERDRALRQNDLERKWFRANRRRLLS